MGVLALRDCDICTINQSMNLVWPEPTLPEKHAERRRERLSPGPVVPWATSTPALSRVYLRNLVLLPSSFVKLVQIRFMSLAT